MRPTLSGACALSILLSAGAGHAENQLAETPDRYFLSIPSIAVQEAVDDAAAKGHRVVAIADDCEKFLLLIEPTSATSLMWRYRMVTTGVRNLETLLNDAGREGFQVDPDVAPAESLCNGRVSTSVLLRRALEGSAPYEYRLVSPPGRHASEQAEAWAKEGLMPVQVAAQRLVLSRRPTTGGASAATPTRPFLVVRGSLKDASTRAAEAATRGYEMVASGTMGSGPEVILVLAADPDGWKAPALKLVWASSLPRLAVSLDDESATGFRLWRAPVIAENGTAIAVLEQVTDANGRVAYSLIGPVGADEIQRLSAGRTPVALVTGGRPTSSLWAISQATQSSGTAPGVTPPTSQTPVASLDRLREVIELGTVVKVTSHDGEVLGSLVQADAESLSLMTRGELVRIEASSVERVRLRDKTERFKKVGFIVGLGAGVGLASYATYVYNSEDHYDWESEGVYMAWFVGPLIGGALGYAAGWGLGSLWPGTTLYVAPSLTATEATGGRLSPGLAVNVRFGSR